MRRLAGAGAAALVVGGGLMLAAPSAQAVVDPGRAPVPFDVPEGTVACGPVAHNGNEFSVFKDRVLCRYARATAMRILRRDSPYIWEFGSSDRGTGRRLWHCDVFRGNAPPEQSALCIKKDENRVVGFVPFQTGDPTTGPFERSGSASATLPEATSPFDEDTACDPGCNYLGTGTVTIEVSVGGDVKSREASATVRLTLQSGDRTAYLSMEHKDWEWHPDCAKGTVKWGAVEDLGELSVAEGEWGNGRFDLEGLSRSHPAKATGTYSAATASVTFREEFESGCTTKKWRGTFQLERPSLQLCRDGGKSLAECVAEQEGRS